MKKQLALFAFSFLIFIFSCKTKEDTFNLTPKPERQANVDNKLDKVFAQNAAQSQSFKVDATTGGTFTSQKGNVYSIAPNIFAKKDGTPVIGQVDILVKEINMASEMILSNKPTATDQGEMLQSFGEFKVDAFQGNNELILQPKAVIDVAVPQGQQDSVGIQRRIPMWDGDTVIKTTLIGRNYENVNVTLTANQRVSKGIEWKEAADIAISGTSRLTFVINKLGTWRNCDVLYSRGTPTTVICYFTNVYNDSIVGSSYQGIEPSLCFFKRKGENTLVKLYNDIISPPAGKAGFLSYLNSFDIGMQGTFLAIVYKGGKFYAASKDVTIGSPASGKDFFGIDFVLQEVTEAEMLALIAVMNSK